MVVVITGASAGVGRATALEFARRGADVALLARGLDGLEAARREIEALGRRALVVQVDVADAGAVERAAERVERELGAIDVWVNDAMTSVFSPVIDTRPEEYRRVMEVNYLGVVHGTLAALARMRPRDRGVIVQVSSALAYRSIPLQSAYCASKHAVKGFTESLLTELRHDRSNVHVTMVHLPGLNTPQFEWVKSRLPRKAQPVPPIYQPEVAARAIVWAASHRRRGVSVGWPTVKAIVGNRVAPGLIDRILARRGYDAQQYDGVADPEKPHNLWRPLDGDHGAHGAFDARAKRHSAQVWANLHRGLLAGALVAAAAIYFFGRARRISSTVGRSRLFLPT
jgi:NAD(P)-dependent dehydrogenase (short-subunit alcohol dehydrogenase family)